MRDIAANDPFHDAIDVIASCYPVHASDGEKYAWIDDLQRILEAQARARTDAAA